MPSSISKTVGSSKQPVNDLLPRTAHSAIIYGQTGCGKTVFVLDLLEGPFRGGGGGGGRGVGGRY